MPEAQLLNLEEIKAGLKDKKLYVIARQLEISYPTLKKFLDDKYHNFTIETLTKVSNYIKSLSNKK